MWWRVEPRPGANPGAAPGSGARAPLSAIDHQFAVCDGDLPAGIVVQPYLTLLIPQEIGDLIATHLFPAVVDGFAAGFVAGYRILVLHVFLGFLAGVATCRSACDRGHLLARTAANLVAEGSADQGAGHGTHKLVLVLHRSLVGYRNLFTLLAGGADGFGDRLDRQHLSKGGLWRGLVLEAVVGHHRPRGLNDDTDDNTCDCGFIHDCLLT